MTTAEREGILYLKGLHCIYRGHNTNRFPKSLNHRHRTLLRELASGTPQGLAAERVGYGENHVSQLMKWPLFQEELARLQDTVDEQFTAAEGEKQSLAWYQDRLNREIGPSLAALVRLRDNAESEQVQMSSARDLLDRAGLKKADDVREAVRVDLSVEVGQLIGAMTKEGILDAGTD